MKNPTLTFMGAAGTVTGSRYLLSAGKHRILIDCGLFQGKKALRKRNKSPWAFPLDSLDAVCLTHAHLDHSGLVPRMVADGYRGPVYGSAATVDLCGLLWPDSGYLQEEEAAYQSRRKHQAIKPLYGRAEAEAALKRLRVQAADAPLEIGPFVIRWRPVGHILGACSISVEVMGRRITFSGDVGRPVDPMMRPPLPLDPCDYLVIESTYGDRQHPASDLADDLGQVIKRTSARGGVVLIPAFAVGRSQAMLHIITELKKAGSIPPSLPVFLNSPMAINASDIYCRYLDQHRLTTNQCEEMCADVTYVRDVEESKALNQRVGPMVIIAASGMLTGGRILHHLIAFGQDVRSSIVVCGYQAEGTRGRSLVDGRRHLKIFGQDRAMRASVEQVGGLSGHADATELIAWLESSQVSPNKVFVTHGEPSSRGAFAARLIREKGWLTEQPEPGEVAQL